VEDGTGKTTPFGKIDRLTDREYGLSFKRMKKILRMPTIKFRGFFARFAT
jgi:hypothetical protein